KWRRCGTYPIAALPRRAGWPSTEIVPQESGISPRIALSRVDLPAPLGPRMARNSPGWTESCTSCQMVRPPRAMAASSTWMTGERPAGADVGEVVTDRSVIIASTPYEVAGRSPPPNDYLPVAC